MITMNNGCNIQDFIMQSRKFRYSVRSFSVFAWCMPLPFTKKWKKSAGNEVIEKISLLVARSLTFNSEIFF